MALAALTTRSPRAQLMKRISPELKAFRLAHKKEQKAVADILQDPCYRPVTTEGLHMPSHFVDVGAWCGKTWSANGGHH